MGQNNNSISGKICKLESVVQNENTMRKMKFFPNLESGQDSYLFLTLGIK